MAGEMYMTESAAGVTPYTHLRDDSNGQLWDRVNEEFTTEVSANVTNYNLDLTMIAPYRYHGDIPSGVPRGRYFLEYFTRTTGQNPAWDDDHKGTSAPFDYNGSTILPTALDVLSAGMASIESATTPEADSVYTVIAGRFHATISGTTLTIYENDDTTVHATKTVATDAGAAPVTGVST